MKKNHFITLLACTILSCNSSTEEASKVNNDSTPPATETPTVTMPYTATYSSDWAIGNQENVKTVLELYKAFEENRIDEFDKYLADTVVSQSYDAKHEVLSKADVIKELKEFRNTFDSVSEEFVSFVPLHSKDKNEDWVGTWMKEKVVRKNGTRDSTYYMETWRFKDNKLVGRLGFAQYRGF